MPKLSSFIQRKHNGNVNTQVTDWEEIFTILKTNKGKNSYRELMQTCKKNKETGINKRKWSKNFHKEILNLTSNQIQTEKIMGFFIQ